MSDGAVGGLIVIFLIVCIGVFVALDWPDYAEYQYKATKKAYWSRKHKKPYRAKVYRSSDEKERHEHEHREDEKNSWFASKTLSAITIMIATIAAVFAFMTYLATRDQARTARDQELRSLRAYIIVRGGYAEIFVGKHLKISYTFDNAGQTPAFDATWYSHITQITQADIFGITAVNSKECIEMMSDKNAHRFIGKEATMIRETEDLVTNQQALDFISEKIGFRIEGRVCYRDIFDKIRTTDFCSAYVWKDGKPAELFCGIEHSQSN